MATVGGGKGINIRIDQWLRDQTRNKIVILHANAEKEVQEKRFWLKRWAPYFKKEKVKILPYWLTNCDEKRLLDELEV